MYLFSKLDFEILKGISIITPLVIKMSDTSTSFLFSFNNRFMNADYSFNPTPDGPMDRG